MPNAIDQRLASLTHQQRIRSLARVDRLTRRVGLIYNRMGRDLLRLASVPEADVVQQIDRTIDDAFKDVHLTMLDGFESEFLDSYKGAANSMIRAVPWGWFRLANPVVVEAEEPVIELTRAQKREIIESTLFPPPDGEAVERALNHAGPDGLVWDERLAYWNGPAREEIRTILISGMSDPGVGVASLRKALEPAVGNVRFKAQRIARTEGRRMAELGQQEAYAGVSELIDSMQIIATLDIHTRPAHVIRDGKTYKQQANGSYVAADGEFLPDLPDEPNCRCFASPILKVPKEIENDPAVAAQFENAARNVIPDPAAYVLWWATADDKARKQAVGARRLSIVTKRLASRGMVPEWEDFLDPDGNLVSIDRLKRQTWKAWDGRKAKVREVIGQRELLLRQIAAAGFDVSKIIK